MSSSDEGIDHLESEEEVAAPKQKRTRKPKKKKDPNAPKRNQSAFFLYSNANRNRVKAENPDAKFGDIVSLTVATGWREPSRWGGYWPGYLAVGIAGAERLGGEEALFMG